MKRRQKRGFLGAISTKITLTNEKERSKRKREKEGEEKKSNGCSLTFYNGYKFGCWNCWTQKSGCWRPGSSVVFMRRANKIEDANHYILRTLTGHGKSLSYQELLNICKLDTLECSKKKQSLVLLFKCIRNIGPKYIRDFFSIRETSYSLRGNGVNLCVLKFNLNFMRNSFTYKCAQLWNKRSEDVKLVDNVNVADT